MIHTSIRVYANGSRTINGVSPEDLESHLAYNKTHRWGCAIFIDGKCVQKGYLFDEQIAEIEAELLEKPCTQIEVTKPYK